MASENNPQRRILSEALNRPTDDPNAPINLSRQPRPFERLIQIVLLACGVLSIFTTLGILGVLLNESVAFFNRPLWEDTNRAIIEDIDPEQRTFQVAASGGAVHTDDTIRLSDEILYVEQFDNNSITVDITGTGGGFNRFCSDDETERTDINDASRPINDNETERCAANGIEPVEFRIGTDAIAITVNSENDFVTDVTIDELRQIFATADLWSDVRDEWPEEPILRFMPGTDSGTFDFFVDAIFEGDVQAALLGNPNTSEDDDQLANGIRRNEYGVGFFGYAYYINNEDALNVVSVDGVEPSVETVEDTTYSLSRPLFIYVNRDSLQNKEQVAAFTDYYITHVNEEIEGVGYFAISEDVLDEARQTWLDITGTEAEENDEGNLILPEVDPSTLNGEILVAGSSTVAPITERIAEVFQEDGFLPRITATRGFNDTEAVSHAADTSIEVGDQATLREFFTHTVWQPAIREFGILPLVYSTLVTSLIAMLVALPLGIGAAIYLSEYAPENVRKVLKPILEILAGIPTVVYGYFALTFMTPFLRGIFGADVVQFYNTASAGIVVGILIIPLVSSMSEDALSAVPRALREASYGLGATKLETTLKVVFPAALSGILAAFIVAISRAIGETMIVAIAAGAGPLNNIGQVFSQRGIAIVFESAETMTGHIARISGGDLSYDSIDYNSIFAIGLLLFFITLVLNLISRSIISRFRESY